MPMNPTPIARDAIIAALNSRKDTEGTFRASIGELMCEFTAYFTTEVDTDEDNHGRSYDVSICTLIGAWAESPETGDVIFAGNRDELVELIDLVDVRMWEDAQGVAEDEK